MSETARSSRRWAAWQRTGKDGWKLIAYGSTEAEARDNLDALPFTGKFRDIAILPTGRTPWDNTPPRPAV